MTFEYVSRVPPEGGGEQEMLCVRGSAFRLTPAAEPDDHFTMFAVWAQAEMNTSIEIIGGESGAMEPVGTAWRRIRAAFDGASDVLIRVPDGANVYFYKAKLETGNRATDWTPAPEDTDEAISNAQNTAEAVCKDFQRVVRMDANGLHVGDNQSNGEVLIDSNSVNVVMNGQKYSKFASNYVQFGNYQLRRSADGGLVFKLKEG